MIYLLVTFEMIKDILFNVMFVLLFIGVIVFLIYLKKSSKESKVEESPKNENKNDLSLYKELKEEQIKVIDGSIDINHVKEEAFKLYKELQLLENEENDEKLKEITSEELYKKLINNRLSLKNKHQKYVIENISLNDIKLTNIVRDKGNTILTLHISLTLNEYILFIETGKLVKGSKTKFVNKKQIIKISKKAENILDNCPHCKAPINHMSSFCEYCKAPINEKDEESLYKICGIENIDAHLL